MSTWRKKDGGAAGSRSFPICHRSQIGSSQKRNWKKTLTRKNAFHKENMKRLFVVILKSVSSLWAKVWRNSIDLRSEPAKNTCSHLATIFVATLIGHEGKSRNEMYGGLAKAETRHSCKERAMLLINSLWLLSRAVLSPQETCHSVTWLPIREFTMYSAHVIAQTTNWMVHRPLVTKHYLARIKIIGTNFHL